MEKIRGSGLSETPARTYLIVPQRERLAESISLLRGYQLGGV
jgi:hypothetical protein